MDIFLEARKKVVSQLWKRYLNDIIYLDELKLSHLVPDHLAIIELGYGNSSRQQLFSLLTNIGFIKNGEDYLPEKHNDFLWMADALYEEADKDEIIPQIVLADFRFNEFSKPVKDIINKCAANQLPYNHNELIAALESKNSTKIADFIIRELLKGRSWPQLNAKEYACVLEENELLAWVLLNGRKVNHFGIDIQLSSNATSLRNFLEQMPQSMKGMLNSADDLIKGSADMGIEQASTLGKILQIELADRTIETRDSFIEFVWRYPLIDNPSKKGDYFTGFQAGNANKVIESLYI
jgi:hypothetical protein